MKTTSFLPSFAAIALTVSSAQGALLLQYGFLDVFPDDTFANTYLPTTTANPAIITGGAVTSDGPTSGSSATPKIRRMNIGATGVENWNSHAQYVYFRTQAANTTLEAAVANDSYFSITINPAQLVNLTELTFFSRNNALDNVTDSGFAVRSSLTGTTNLLVEEDLPGRRNTESKEPGDNFYSINLAANSAFTGVSAPVTFRFYLFSDSNITETDFDTISFHGNAVPEPSSALLGGLGVAALLLNRRRRN